MKTLKKLTGLLLVLVLLLCLGGTAGADGEYSYSNGVLTISGDGTLSGETLKAALQEMWNTGSLCAYLQVKVRSSVVCDISKNNVASVSYKFQENVNYDLYGRASTYLSWGMKASFTVKIIQEIKQSTISLAADSADVTVKVSKGLFDSVNLPTTVNQGEIVNLVVSFTDTNNLYVNAITVDGVPVNYSYDITAFGYKFSFTPNADTHAIKVTTAPIFSIDAVEYNEHLEKDKDQITANVKAALRGSYPEISSVTLKPSDDKATADVTITYKDSTGLYPAIDGNSMATLKNVTLEDNRITPEFDVNVPENGTTAGSITIDQIPAVLRHPDTKEELSEVTITRTTEDNLSTAGEKSVTFSFAGNKDYKPAEATVTFTLDKAKTYFDIKLSNAVNGCAVKLGTTDITTDTAAVALGTEDSMDVVLTATPGAAMYIDKLKVYKVVAGQNVEVAYTGNMTYAADTHAASVKFTAEKASTYIVEVVAGTVVLNVAENVQINMPNNNVSAALLKLVSENELVKCANVTVEYETIEKNAPSVQVTFTWAVDDVKYPVVSTSKTVNINWLKSKVSLASDSSNDATVLKGYQEFASFTVDWGEVVELLIIPADVEVNSASDLINKLSNISQYISAFTVKDADGNTVATLDDAETLTVPLIGTKINGAYKYTFTAESDAYTINVEIAPIFTWMNGDDGKVEYNSYLSDDEVKDNIIAALADTSAKSLISDVTWSDDFSKATISFNNDGKYAVNKVTLTVAGLKDSRVPTKIVVNTDLGDMSAGMSIDELRSELLVGLQANGVLVEGATINHTDVDLSTAGEKSVTFSFAGTKVYQPAADVAVNFTLVKEDLASAQITLDANTSLVYTGNEIKPAVTVTLGNKTLTAGADYTVAYANNINAGEATVTVTGMGNYTGTAETTFQITKSGAAVTAKSYLGETEESNFTYGETITITGTVTATGKAPETQGYSLRSPMPDVSLLYEEGSAVLGKAYLDGNTFTIAYDTTKRHLPVGTHALKVNYNGGNMEAMSATVTITLQKADPVVTVPTGLTATYGDTLADVTLPAGWVWNNPTALVGDAGTQTHKVAYTPNEADLSYYNTLEADVTITVGKLTLTGVNMPAEIELDVYCATPEAIIAKLPTSLTGTDANGKNHELLLTWKFNGNAFDNTPGAKSGFEWSIDLGKNFDAKDSGITTVKNASAQAVQHTGTDATITYAGNTYNVAQMFTIDANAGAATYAIIGGEGAGTLNGAELSITKAGTITIKMTTVANMVNGRPYAAGEATATLTVNKGNLNVDVPNGLTAQYGDTLADITLPNATNGVWSWKNATAAVGEAGEQTHKVIFTPNASDLWNTKELDVTITVIKANMPLDAMAQTFLGAMPQSTFTYGDTITVKVAPVATALLSLDDEFATPVTNQVALFFGNKQISAPVDAVDGVYSLNYATTAKILPIGESKLIVRYVGNNNINDASVELAVSINQAQLTVSAVETVDRTYEPGNLNVSIKRAELSGMIGNDDVSVDTNGMLATIEKADAGNYTEVLLPEKINLKGADAAYYMVKGGVCIDASVTISPVTYAVTVNNGTGSGEYEAGTTVTINANPPAEGKQFAGWTTVDGVTFEDAIAATTTFVMPAKAVTVSANYIDKPVAIHYVIVYNANGGEGVMPNQYFDYGETKALEANLFNREGYVFTGWNTQPDATGTAYADGQIVTMYGSAILYAQWKTENVPVTPTPVPTPVPTPDVNPLVITMHPADQMVTPGESAKFSIWANGDDVTYQWYINRNDGRGWVKLQGGTSAVHETSAADLAYDGFQYLCEVRDVHGNALCSNVAVLYVAAQPDIPETGDEVNVMLLCALMMISGMGCLILMKKRRQFNH